MTITKTLVRSGVNPRFITEKNHPGEAVVSEYGNYHTRGQRSVAGGVNGVAHNSILVKDGHFDGYLFEGVRAGETALRGVIENGPAELADVKLVWPTAPDGADAGSDNVAETAALKASLVAEMRALNIKVVR